MFTKISVDGRQQTVSEPDDSSVVELDSTVVDRTQLQVGIPVPIQLCNRTENKLEMNDYQNGERSLPHNANEIDLGQCSGFCPTTFRAGSNSCEAVPTDTNVLTHSRTGRKKKETIICESACVCDYIERCPLGWFWNA